MSIYISRTDDPVADFHRYTEENEKALSKFPKCADCGEPITQEDAVFINGEWICDECLDSYRREIDVEW